MEHTNAAAHHKLLPGHEALHLCRARPSDSARQGAARIESRAPHVRDGDLGLVLLPLCQVRVRRQTHVLKAVHAAHGSTIGRADHTRVALAVVVVVTLRTRHCPARARAVALGSVGNDVPRQRSDRTAHILDTPTGTERPARHVTEQLRGLAGDHLVACSAANLTTLRNFGAGGPVSDVILKQSARRNLLACVGCTGVGVWVKDSRRTRHILVQHRFCVHVWDGQVPVCDVSKVLPAEQGKLLHVVGSQHCVWLQDDGWLPEHRIASEPSFGRHPA